MVGFSSVADAISVLNRHVAAASQFEEGIENETRDLARNDCADVRREVAAADFGQGGPNLPTSTRSSVLRQDSTTWSSQYGTSKCGSAGHLALAIRESGDESVYTANFYADRARKHAEGYYTDDLMVRVPKQEYLFKTQSSLGATASFGLDFGEIYKRSVIGVRVYGVPASEKEALAAFFGRINADYHNGSKHEYHDGEVRYDYLRLNCAKTHRRWIQSMEPGTRTRCDERAKLFSGRRVVAAANANIPRRWQ